jgi:hypothetical protein
MTISPGQKCITLQSTHGAISIPYSPPAAGEKYIILRDMAGRNIAVKYQAPAVGEKYVIVYDSANRPIAISMNSSGPSGTSYIGYKYGHQCVLTAEAKALIMTGVSWLVEGSTLLMSDIWTGKANGVGWGFSGYGAFSTLSGETVALSDGTLLYVGNAVYKSVNNGLTWSLLNGSPGWTARYDNRLAVMSDDEIIMSGGYDISAGKAAGDIWHSTDEGVTWSILTFFTDPIYASPGDFLPRYQHRMACLSDDTLLIMGGITRYGHSGTCYDNGVWGSTDGGVNWSSVCAHASWSDRSRFGLCRLSTDTLILTGGGADTLGNPASDEVWESVDGGASWTEIAQVSGLGPLSYHTAIRVPGDRIMVVGGVKTCWTAWVNSSPPVDWGLLGVWMSNFDFDTWNQTATQLGPFTRP